MTEVSPLTQATTTQTPTTSQTTSETVSADFDTFLTLLTAQIQNQDPLEPMDSTQFVEQLATFSNLEQQVQTNTILQSMADMMSSMHNSAAAEWVGKTVAVPSSVIQFDGSDVEFQFDVPAGTDAAFLAVRGGDGQLIGRSQIDLTSDSHTWSGQLDDRSGALPNGNYFAEIETYSGGAFNGAIAPKIVAQVSDVQVTGDSIVVLTDEGMSAPIESVDTIRQ